MRWLSGTLLAGSMLLAMPAHAQLSEEEVAAERAKASSDLKGFATETNEACKSKLRGEMAWDTFSNPEWRQYNVASFCRSTFDVLQKFCKGKLAARYIRAKVKMVRCAYGGRNKRAFAVTKGLLELRLDFDATDYDAFVRQALLEKL